MVFPDKRGSGSGTLVLASDNLQLINGRPPLDANGRPIPDAFPGFFTFTDTGFARARPPPAVRRPLSAAL